MKQAARFSAVLNTRDPYNVKQDEVSHSTHTMLFLTTRLTHFIYRYMASDSKRENPLPPFRGQQQGIFYMHNLTDRTALSTTSNDNGSKI